MIISLYHRGRFNKIEDASAKQINNNTWSLRLPLTALRAILRTDIEMDTLDGCVITVDEMETENTLGHKVDDEALYITAWSL